MVVSESFEESEICRSNDGGERLKKCPPPPLLSLPISSKLSLSQISTTYYISKEELPKKGIQREGYQFAQMVTDMQLSLRV